MTLKPLIINSATSDRDGTRNINFGQYSDPINDPAFWIIEGIVMGGFIGFGICVLHVGGAI